MPRQAADRGQPSRRPCAVPRLSDPDLAFPLSAAARLGRALPVAAGRRASDAIAVSPPPSTMPPARPSTRPPSCSASAFPAARRSSGRRIWAIPCAVPLPRPLKGSAEPHFSFAGLKSAVARASRCQYIACGGYRRVVPAGGGRLPDRPHHAGARRVDATALVVAGGVAAKPRVRARAAGPGDGARPALRRAAACGCAPTMPR
jgi:N6-L-threonylcarbamoyladenine synthase